MDPLAFAVIATSRNNVGNLARSALPAAPTVAPAERVRLARSRYTLALALRRLADIAAPTAAADHAPARLTLSVDRRSGVSRWDESRCKPSPTM
jgi:hypothetical protein